MNDHRLFKTVAGTALILFPVLLLLTYLLAAMGNDYWSSFIALVTNSFLPLVAVGLAASLYARAPRWAVVAGTATLVAVVIGSASWDYEGLFTAIAGEGALEPVATSAFMTILASLLGLLSVGGLIALSVGLHRAAQQPSWMTGAQVLGLLLFTASWFTVPIVGIAAALCLLVGYGGLGWQMVSGHASGDVAAPIGERARA